MRRIAPYALAFLTMIAVMLAIGDGSAASLSDRPPSDTAIADGWLGQVARAMVAFQREANREIAERMAAIRDGQSAFSLLIAVALGFAYGAIHAAGPGHGKMVVMSYFVAREARIGRGVLMGAQIAALHVLSAIVVVALADLLLRRVLGSAPSEVPAIRLASYAAITVVGAYMLIQALRGRGHAHHDHTQQGLLATGVGLIPCTGAVLVMLYALANGILYAGVLVTMAIGIGMAATMAALGMLTVIARRAVTRRLVRTAEHHGRLGKVLECLGAVVITLLGAALFASAL
jgi:ABC-type nickel/cobalt efflux system permease component RcnA